MNAKQKHYFGLVAAVLSATPLDDGPEPRIEDDRMLAVLRGDAQFSDEEERLLLTSLATRQRFLDLLEVERAFVAREWKAKGFRIDSVGCLAADDGTPRPVHMQGGDYAVDLIPMDPRGESWKLVVQLTEPLRRSAARGFRLVGGGEVWASGNPDDQGRLVAFFGVEDDVRRRLGDQRLILQPG